MHDTESLILQNRLLTEEIQRRISQLAAINAVAATVSQSLDLNVTLETALQVVVDTVQADAGGISLIDDKAGEVVMRAQRGWVRDFVNPPMRIPFGKGMSGRVIRTNDVVIENDLKGTGELAVPRFREEPFRSIAMAPMHARGKIIGILSIMSLQPASFGPEVADLLRAIADTVGIALDNARLYESSVEQENRLSAVIQSTGDGIIATDQSGRIEMANYTACAMFQVNPAELIGMPLREAPLHPRLRDSLLFALSSRAGTATDSDRGNSFQVTLDTGQSLGVLVSPVYAEQQVSQQIENDGWVIVLQDITHLRQEEMARTQFIQAAAHDMRNPLAATSNSLEMLRGMVGTADEMVVEIIDIAHTSVGRMQDLIDDLLNLEHIEHGYNVNPTDVDMGELLYEVVAAIRPITEEKGIHIEVQLMGQLPIIQADFRLVSRAVINYLDNAIKYVQRDGQVLLRAFINEPMLHVEVLDNGPGIPLDAQARLFERFFRVDDGSDIRGTGLGLAIVKSVAEAHGGAVYVHSRPGRGSNFGMALPIAQ